MAYTLSTNQIDSTGATEKKVTLPPTNFGADWAVDASTNDSIIVLNAITGLDTPETIKFHTEKVANIYKNSSIDVSGRAPIRTGRRIVVSTHEVWTEEDSSNPDLPKHYAPAACSCTVTVPEWSSVKTTDVLAIILRTISGYFDTDDSVTECKRIARLLRGAEKPSDM